MELKWQYHKKEVEQMEYVLQTNALKKVYRNYTALQNLSMHVPKGSIYGFVGKNGAGKTTLIRLVCGLQRETDGEILLYGTSSRQKEIAKVRRRIGAVIETPSIYLNMTAKENLKEQHRILGLPSYDGIEELLSLVGLSDTGKKKAGNFSLGMRQRLGIAIALAGNPDFLILDEPVNGLDPQGIIEMREMILKLNRERGITVLISSHILDELSRLATHFGFIDRGHIVKEISAEELDRACRKCTHLIVSDTKILSCVLDELKMEYTILSQEEADVFDTVNVTELVLKLAARNCEVKQIRQREESLENYYINLLGGVRNE